MWILIVLAVILVGFLLYLLIELVIPLVMILNIDHGDLSCEDRKDTEEQDAAGESYVQRVFWDIVYERLPY
jgi:hypothetical protein